MEADQDGDGKLSFDEFVQTVANTVRFDVLCWSCLSLVGYERLDMSALRSPCRVILSCTSWHLSVFFDFFTDVHPFTYILTLLLFPGYRKTNDPGRLVLDVGNAHLATYAYQPTDQPTTSTHPLQTIIYTPPRNPWQSYDQHCYLLSLPSTSSRPPLFYPQLAGYGILPIWRSFQKAERTTN